MFQTKVVKKIKTRILCSITPPPPENHAFYKIMWKNIVEPDSHMTVWRMRIAWCAPKSTYTLSECVILTACTLQQLPQERTSLLRYAYIACLVIL